MPPYTLSPAVYPHPLRVFVCRMVRKRKSLPRDSKGFEPIDQYLKEVDEDLNQSSNGECEGGSGEGGRDLISPRFNIICPTIVTGMAGSYS